MILSYMVFPAATAPMALALGRVAVVITPELRGLELMALRAERVLARTNAPGVETAAADIIAEVMDSRGRKTEGRKGGLGER